MNFCCPLTQMNLSELKTNKDKLAIWKRVIKFGNFNMKLLRYFDVETKEEYIDLIETNLQNDEKLTKIFELFKINKKEEAQKIYDEDKKNRLKLFMNSIKYINEDGTLIDEETPILIRLLEELDKNNALFFYKEYKIIAEETDLDDKEIEDLIEDYIFKHLIYGIFINNNLVGCAIVNNKYFKIDDYVDKINTFYIQEIFINTKGKNYGNYLFSYIITKCPEDLQYISFMTKKDNKAMYKIAKNNNFILQEKSSGDDKNPSLFIGINPNYI
jgi:hypothetical protein